MRAGIPFDARASHTNAILDFRFNVPIRPDSEPLGGRGVPVALRHSRSWNK